MVKDWRIFFGFFFLINLKLSLSNMAREAIPLPILMISYIERLWFSSVSSVQVIVYINTWKFLLTLPLAAFSWLHHCPTYSYTFTYFAGKKSISILVFSLVATHLVQIISRKSSYNFIYSDWRCSGIHFGHFVWWSHWWATNFNYLFFIHENKITLYETNIDSIR